MITSKFEASLGYRRLCLKKMADNKHAIAHLGHFWRIVIDNIHRRQICSGLYMVSGPPYRVLSRDVSQVAYWFRRPALAKAWTSAWTRGNASPSTGAVSFFFFFQFPQSLITGNGLIGADSYNRRHSLFPSFCSQGK